MAKKITAVVKLQLPAGKATPAPPVGSTLGPHGINIPGFTKEFNAKTASQAGLIIPCVVTIYQDRSFTFILKTPPTPVLIKKALGIDTASARPNRDKVGKLTKAQVEEIAKMISVCRPHGVYMAHNHTDSPCFPSDADDDMTKKVQVICNLNNVRLYDHCIFAPDGIYSYFLTNRLDDIAREYSVSNLFGKNF